jgi:tetratricopeptide (TPR) repeat protein
MRVNVQLIDAEFGHHLWAERFDKPLADLFDMQDEIVARLAGALNSQLVEVEARRAEKAPNPNSMDLYFQGEACINRGASPDNLARARDFYDRAMAADPNNVDACVGSARADIMAAMQFAVSDPSATLAAAEAKLTSVLSLVPDHARGHVALGLVYMATKRASECVAECEHALALDRNLATAHGLIGSSKLQLLRPEETEAHVLEALRLSPRDMGAYHWTYNAGVAKVALGLHDQALVWLRRTVEANRNHPYAHFVLGATLARLGRQDEARSAVKAGLALYPSFAVSRFSAFWLTSATDKPTYVAQFGPLWEAMRMAGVPE